jgi:hypothetical protein
MDEVNKINETFGKNDEQLLAQFFAEHPIEVEDRGFTNRVMRRLPDRSRKLNRIWTVICALAAVAVFILTKGWITITGALQGLLTDAVTGASQVSVLSVMVTLFTLTALTCYGLVVSTD